MITTSEWQGLIREEKSEGQVYAPAKPAFPPSMAVKPLAKLRADEQEHHIRRRLKASWQCRPREALWVQDDEAM